MGVNLLSRTFNYIGRTSYQSNLFHPHHTGVNAVLFTTVNQLQFNHTAYGGRSLSNTSITSDCKRTTLNSIPLYECEKSAVNAVYNAVTAPQQQYERAFYINDIGVVDRQYRRWCDELPNVRPYYAVKCNPDTVLLELLHGNGTGFDCASGDEMKQCLELGVSPNDIIFANPIKSINDLKFASERGIKKMTFDNIDELYKIQQLCPNAELVLRLLPDDSGSVMRFGSKFGAPAEHIDILLNTTKQLNLTLLGVSFHIGSGCYDPMKYDSAIKLARSTFNRAVELGLPPLKLLDLGGGFPGAPLGCHNSDGSPQFELFTNVIRNSLDEHFSDAKSCGIDIIAEPGRYMATAWSTLFALVQGKRSVPVHDKQKKFLYYINDGVYGSFNCLMFDHAKANPIPAWKLWNNKLSLDSINTNKSHNTINTKMTQSMYINMYNAMINDINSGSSNNNESSRYQQQRMVHSDSTSNTTLTKGTFFGPTCDSMDCIATDYPIEELHVGDWIAFEHYGAYTSAAATTFNGMPKPIINYVRSKLPSPMMN